jgi:hypothetical protein
MWHSRRDLAQLVDRCLRDESVAADVFYGVSDNATWWFDISHARTDWVTTRRTTGPGGRY